MLYQSHVTPNPVAVESDGRVLKPLSGGRWGVGSRRATGVTGLLAALRKRSADVMQPPAKHNELLR